jgi:CheY-like chemotaxis protein
MAAMACLFLVHWNEAEAAPRVNQLRAAGHQVIYPGKHGAALREAKTTPDAFLIDLSRLPSHGRECARVFRQRKATRHVPLVFLEGEPEKVEVARRDFPDAVFTSWKRCKSAIRHALANPPANPVVPASVSGTTNPRPLAAKLGIGSDSLVALINPPEAFYEMAEAFPDGVRYETGRRAEAPLTLWFASSQHEFDSGLARALSSGGQLWIFYPKKASGIVSDLRQAAIRRTLINAGWVDYKICAFDATWTGMLFSRRRK